MNNKCEWKDGRFYPCDFGKTENFDATGECANMGNILAMTGHWNFCPVCGADIRKPEPELIIKKSGDTFVIKYNCIDYLVIEPDSQYFDPNGNNDYSRLLFDDIIEPISDKDGKQIIEITDDIAKLRPMVVNAAFNGFEPAKLVGFENGADYPYGIYWMGEFDSIEKCRLATVADLT